MPPPPPPSGALRVGKMDHKNSGWDNCTKNFDSFFSPSFSPHTLSRLIDDRGGRRRWRGRRRIYSSLPEKKKKRSLTECDKSHLVSRKKRIEINCATLNFANEGRARARAASFQVVSFLLDSNYDYRRPPCEFYLVLPTTVHMPWRQGGGKGEGKQEKEDEEERRIQRNLHNCLPSFSLRGFFLQRTTPLF